MAGLTYTQLMNFKPAAFEDSATAWRQWADSALEHAGFLNDKVGQHIAKGHWDGLTSELARGKVNVTHAHISNSAGQLRKVENKLTQAGKAFEQAQQTLKKAVSDAEGAGFDVKPHGDGALVVPKPDDKNLKGKSASVIQALARSHQTAIDTALTKARLIDQNLADSLNSLGPNASPTGPTGSGPSGPTGGAGPSGWNGSYGSSGPPPLTHPSGKVADWIRQAIDIMKAHGVNVSDADAPIIATIIQHESGGDPNAINLTDINAREGHPSKGLMQTIDGTFNSYALPGHTSIYNPVDNIIAGTRYALSRYHSLSNVPGIRGLANHTGYVGY